MLHERWLKIAEANADKPAVFDFVSERKWWSFGDLASAAGRDASRFQGPAKIRFPRGNGIPFIIEVILGWQEGCPIFPMEEGQHPPTNLDFRNIPEVAHIKATSASTGKSRLVLFSEEQLAADADAIVEAMSLSSTHPNLGVVSLAHSYGFANLILPLLLHGIPLVMGVSPLPTSVLEASRLTEQITLPAVPAMWSAWNSAKCIPDNIAVAISAGAPLPLPLEQEVYREKGLKIHNFYGSTECGGIAFDDSRTPRTHAGFLGRALPGRKLTLQPNGCLAIAGPSVGIGYWPDSSPALQNGSFLSEDQIEMNSNGIVWLGRKSDLINIAGRKVFPATVEVAASSHPLVSNAVAVGIPSRSEARGEEILLCLTLRQPMTDLEIRQFLSAHLPDWQVPKQILRVDQIPTSQRGKTSRDELKKIWAARNV